MEAYKIGFVILHYQVIDQTIKCIQSIIKKIDTTNYEIIVVDNGSTNMTGKILQDKYAKFKKIHIILNHDNLGFSKGNNIGFKYAKIILKCDFIAMLNNDTYLIQNDFFSVIKKEYKYSGFAVMGPKILLRNNEICTMDGKLITLKEEKKYLRNLKVKLFLNYINLDRIILKIKRKKSEKKENYEYLNMRRENVVLHGCALIFSPKYIEKFDGLDEKTFLYREEEFLYIKLMKNNMLSVYNPKLMIFHNEAISTGKIGKNSRLKNRFVYKKLIEANEIFIKELKNNEVFINNKT